MEQAMSPSPQKSRNIAGLDFPQAIKHLTDGKKIHKLEWQDREYFGFLKDGIVMIHKPDGKFYQWIINDGDLIGQDWIIIT